MKKLIALVIVAVMLLGMMPMMAMAAGTMTVYLKPCNEWKSDGARFAVNYFGASNGWASLTDSDGDGYYSCEVPTGVTYIFCRMNGSNTTNDWANKWNQTGDLTNPNGLNCYVVPSSDAWDQSKLGDGNWTTYTPPAVIVDKFTVRAKVPSDWTEVCVYAFDDSNTNVSPVWPGEQGQLTNGWYFADIPVTATNIIVSGMANGSRAQTADLPVSAAKGETVWVTVDSNSNAQTSKTNPELGSETVKIHVNVSAVSWDPVMLYTWGFPGADKYEGTGTWSGSEMTADAYNADWYTIEVPKYVANVIVNNGSSQTSDIPVTAGVESWIVVTGTGSDGYSVSTTAPSGWYTSAPIKVTLNPGEGAVEPTMLTADPDGKVTLPAASRPNYVFDGWYKEAELTNLVGQAGETATFTENATIYAKWSEDVAGRHTITFKDGNNVITSAVTKKLDGNIGTLETLPAGPTAPANYKFVSWVLEDGTEVTTSTQFTAPTNVYAKWEQKPTYTVSFDLNYEGATGAPEAKSTIDGKIELPAASRTGYTFNGWYTAKTEGTKVDNDKVYEANTTLYAQWTKVEYVTVHASVPETWTTAFVYAWNTGAGSNEAWPGAPMTKGTDGWFTAQVPVGYGNLIIAEKDGGEQTKDLTGINQTATEIWVTLTEKEGDKYKADVTYPSDINTDPSEYYLHGYINGADVTGTTYKFVDGKVTVNLTAESYVFVGTDIGSNFMTDGWLGKEVKEATLATDYATGDKLFVPAGNVTFTLVVNDDGTVKLSYAVAAPEGGNQGGNQGGTEGGNQGGNQSGTAGNPEAPAGGTEGGSEVEEITINVKVPADWENPCLWAWQENGDNDINAFDAWPGMALTKGENGWYYAKVPANMNYMIVNAHNGAWQTPDTAIEKSKCDVWAEVVVDAAGQATIKMQYTSPATGDTAIIAPVVFLMVMSVTGLAVLTVGKKKYF